MERFRIGENIGAAFEKLQDLLAASLVRISTWSLDFVTTNSSSSCLFDLFSDPLVQIASLVFATFTISRRDFIVSILNHLNCEVDTLNMIITGVPESVPVWGEVAAHRVLNGQQAHLLIRREHRSACSVLAGRTDLVFSHKDWLELVMNSGSTVRQQAINNPNFPKEVTLGEVFPVTQDQQ